MRSSSLIATAALATLLVVPLASAEQSSSSGGAPQVEGQEIVAIDKLLGTEVRKTGIVRVGPNNFSAAAGRITFSELPTNTVNPTYTPSLYGGAPTGATVSFRGFFAGQALGTAGTCPAGAVLTGCVVGTPTNPLTLSTLSPTTFITEDIDSPASPVLSGSPRFNGPVAVLFDRDLAGIGLDGGFFDSVGSTAITAFRRDGSVIGSVSNRVTGIEFLGLATADGSESIAGLLFSLVGAERGGFEIDNLRFGFSSQLVNVGPQSIPANHPAGLVALLLAVALAGFAAIRLRQR